MVVVIVEISNRVRVVAIGGFDLISRRVGVALRYTFSIPWEWFPHEIAESDGDIV